jgi:hypothetical protein
MEIDTPPMELGQTLAGTDSDDNLINSDKLGLRYVFPAVATTGTIRGQKGRKTGRTITAMLVRNTAAFAILGKRVVKLTEAGGYGDLSAVNGYTCVKADDHCAFSDPGLPSAGCAANDIMWVILEGPTTVLAPHVGGGFDKAIAKGDPLVAATGTTTGTSDEGRVSVGGVLAGGSLAATEAYIHARNNLGRALSARTTGETDGELLVDAFIKL